MTTGELEALLRARLPAEEWALFFEVRNGTGFARKTVRTADAIAMSTWPSRGLELHGFELKVSRSDWQRELANPAKAEEISRFCDRWWVVVGDAEIVQPGELPATWGLMVPKGKKLVVKVEAPILKDVQPIDRLFLAALLRAAQTTGAAAETIKQAREEERERCMKEFEARHSYELREHQTLRAAVDEVEKAAGDHWRLQEWNAGRFGAALRLAMSSDIDGLRTQLHQMSEQARRIAENIERELGADQAKPGSAA